MLCWLQDGLSAFNNEKEREDALTADPSLVHPPSHALPDTLQLVNAALVADQRGAAGVRAKTGKRDSTQKNQ